LSVNVNGQYYKVTVSFGDPSGNAVPSEEDNKKTPVAEKTPAPVVAGEGEPLLAPLEGKFFPVKNTSDAPVKVGDTVKKGQTVCFIEAMKVYNAVAAEKDGVVTAICLKPGDSVEEDKTVLMMIK
jgi:pyruvate carboxylase subunit B